MTLNPFFFDDKISTKLICKHAELTSMPLRSLVGFDAMFLRNYDVLESKAANIPSGPQTFG